MRSLEQLDSWISAKLKTWSSKVSGVPPRRELLEIRRDLLENVRDEIEPKGEGRSVFPYTSIAIHVAASTSAEQERLNAALTQDDALEQDIRELLVEAGCPVPSNLRVTITVQEDPLLASSTPPFQVSYSVEKSPQLAPAAGPTMRPAARLTVLRGKTEMPECVISSDRFSIGRLKEVIGSNDGLRRRNDLAFAEEETTVSREHAQIRFHADAGKFRLYDSMSHRGTSVFRDGRRLEVPVAASRGLQLRSGDEIHLGDARVLFQID